MNYGLIRAPRRGPIAPTPKRGRWIEPKPCETLAEVSRNPQGSRCTGHCCKVFIVGLPPVTLKELPTIVGIGEAKRLGEMLIELGTNPEGAKVYSCRHLLGNGDCGIYAQRPNMCSAYPYGHRCHLAGCTSSAACGVDCDTDAHRRQQMQNVVTVPGEAR